MKDLKLNPLTTKLLTYRNQSHGINTSWCLVKMAWRKERGKRGDFCNAMRMTHLTVAEITQNLLTVFIKDRRHQQNFKKQSYRS